MDTVIAVLDSPKVLFIWTWSFLQWLLEDINRFGLAFMIVMSILVIAGPYILSRFIADMLGKK